MNDATTESNDTILQNSLRPTAAAMELGAAYTGTSRSHNEPASESQITEPIQLSFIRQLSQYLVDPFGLLHRVVMNSRLPPVVAEFSFFVILSLTALWDIILLTLAFLFTWRLLLALGYVIKKLSWIICCMSSGQNQSALKQVLWNRKIRKENVNPKKELLNVKTPI